MQFIVILLLGSLFSEIQNISIIMYLALAFSPRIEADGVYNWV